jgi:FtsP/CotA-like multicopper oxidase with cupredoxin domain
MAVATACGSRLPEVVANDNRVPAGVLRGDTLDLALVVTRARWHPEAPDGPYVDIEAFAEEGGPPRVPAPLIRVPEGTVVRVTVRNALADSTAWILGLHARPAEAEDSVGVAPGQVDTLTFRADSPGTYWYGAYAGNPDLALIEREQMSGALVVDPAGARTDDRVFVMNIWGDDDPADTLKYRNALAINGKSFPHTEELTPTVGDTLRWRVVNATARPHPMHLHGFYFTVNARGTGLRDTVYDAASQRIAVTERMDPGTTMAMTWSPDRDGRWLFHCHIAFHAISPGARLDGEPMDHAAMGEAGLHMAGLVLGIDVKAPPGWQPPPRESPRRLRLFVQEGPKRGLADRTMRYALEYGDGTPDSTFDRVTGPPLVLTRGQPTDITVINQLREPTAVHWHGLELESYSDGVAGFSGSTGKLAPMIAPSDSFVARLTLARAGTFIYHTHLNDLEQLTSGLYGAIIVVEPGETFDSSRDPVFVTGWDGGAEPPRVLLNGDSTPPPIAWRLGARHRLRFINIGPAGVMFPTITLGNDTVTWRALAKDGAALPMLQQVVGRASTILDVGETADFEFAPSQRGEYQLSFIRSKHVRPLVQTIIVR